MAIWADVRSGTVIATEEAGTLMQATYAETLTHDSTAVVTSRGTFKVDGTFADTLRNWFADQGAKARLGETIVISPGYRVLIEGSPVAIFGNRECPQSTLQVWFVGGVAEGGGCAILEKDTTVVPMRFSANGKVVTEVWKIERSAAGLMSLRRPNGQLVIPAQ